MMEITQRTNATNSATSLTQWNALQQETASQVDLTRLLTSIQTNLRARGILAWVELDVALDKAHTKTENVGLGKGTVKRVFNDQNIPISDVDARAIVATISGQDEGKVSAEAIKNLICGLIRGKRLELVQSVFETLDREHVGYISLQEIFAAHDATKHPSVMFGEQTVDQVQQEFQQAFQIATRTTTAISGGTAFVNFYQWMSYFQCVGGHIPSDEYFELLMKRVWRAASRTNLSDITRTNGSIYASSSTTAAVSTAPKTLLQALQDNTVTVTASHVQPALTISTALPVSTPSRLHRSKSITAVSTEGISPRAAHSTTEFLKGSQFAACMVDPSIRQPSPKCSSVSRRVQSPLSASSSSLGGSGVAKPIDAGTSSILTRLRSILKTQGLAGLVALSRQIRLSDDDSDGLLTFAEFKRALQPLESGQLSDFDLRCLFKHLDVDHRALITIQSAIDLIRDPMNPRRLKLVQLAFKTVDRDGSGVLSVNEIVANYDASRHPDVIAGRKSEEQVFHDFIENFDVEARNTNVTPSEITLEQWEQYYQNVSFFISDDDFFELMIRNTWQVTESLPPELLLAASSSSSNNSSISTPVLITTAAGQQRFTRGNGQGHSSHQALAILQPDLADHHQDNRQKRMQSPSSLTASTPSMCVFATHKQSKELRRTIHQLRNALKEQGVAGFISLQRAFRLMDTDGNGSISADEFLRALQHCKVYLPPAESKNLFQFFDANHDGAIEFTEFLLGIREPMSERRLLLVRMAFDLIDKDHNGVLEVSDIVDVYDACKHPDVLSGRKTEKEVFQEFIETFDIDHLHEGKVGFEEWTRYYSNISASIDDDDYFELMMRNAWHISGGHGWCANSSNRRVLVTHADGTTSIEEVRNDLGVKKEDVPRVLAEQMKQNLPQKASFYDVLDHSARSKSTTSTLSLRKSRGNSSELFAACLPSPDFQQTQSRRASTSMTATASTDKQREVPAGIQAILAKLKGSLKAKGAHGFCGLSRRFRLMDDDGNGSLNVHEFRKAMNDCDLGLSENDTRLLFQYFDADRNGSIDFHEFMVGVRDPMTERRLFFVKEAFKRMDKDGNGLLEPSDIIEAYDASRHPDVLHGKKTPEEVCREFLETFDVDGVHNGKITWLQWQHYYHNISASIDDEDYFELMMRNAWHISGGEGWCENSTNRRVLVTLPDGADVVREVKNDLGVKMQDINAKLEAQGQLCAGASVSTSAATRMDVTFSGGSGGYGNGKKIMTLKEVSCATTMAMPPATGVSPSSSDPLTMKCSGELLLHALRHRIQQKKMSDVVQLQKRALEYIDAKTGTISAVHCSECLNAALGLSLTEEYCIGLFDYLTKQYDPEMATRTSANGRIGARFLQNTSTSNRITLRNLFNGLLGQLSPQCTECVHQIFAGLQAQGNGRVFPLALAKSFQAARHPDVAMGLATATQVFEEFAMNFEVSGANDGAIALEHFESYCVNLRATSGSDTYLLLILQHCFLL